MSNSSQHTLAVRRWATHHAPSSPSLRKQLARELIAQGMPGEAANVLSALPTDTGAQLLRGIALHDNGDFSGARTLFECVTRTAPKQAAGWANLGMIAKITGDFETAFSAYDKAVSIAPGDPRIRLNRAVAFLRAGQLERAWADYECRFQLGGSPSFQPDRMLPDIAGMSLAGVRILAIHEDGFGDTIQFSRYLPLLAARGAHVFARVPAPLCRILATLDGVLGIVGPDDPFPECDFHIPMFSLPRAFGTRMDTIPSSTRYLHAVPELTANWSSKLPVRKVLRVGVVWAGQARPWAEGFVALDKRRSLALATLAPLASVPGVDLISLQTGPATGEIRSCGFNIHNPFADTVPDFADTASIAASLDLVVSVDTAAAHLAGATGIPVFLLDRADSCWRWFNGRTDSPWYPTLRIFRQEMPGEWSTVVDAVRRELWRLAGQHDALSPQANLLQ